MKEDFSEEREQVIKALKCLAEPRECCYSDWRCPYYDADIDMCDNITLARDVLKLLGEEW